MDYRNELRREFAKLVTRRWFFRQCGVGLGSIALSSLLGADKAVAATTSKTSDPLAPHAPHFKPKAKRVIYLFMAGAPSQLDLFDYKPALAKYNGKPLPAEVIMGQKYAFIRPDAALFATEFKFARHGNCGAELSEALPHLAEVVDDIALVKSMSTEAFNHAPGQVLMQTGSTQFGRPCFGSWALYGLGSEAHNLPGFVVLLDNDREPPGGNRVWGTGFMPATFQGTRFRNGKTPVLHLTAPAELEVPLAPAPAPAERPAIWGSGFAPVRMLVSPAFSTARTYEEQSAHDPERIKLQSKPCWTPFPISTIIVSRTGVGPWTLGLGYEASDSANTRRISETTRSMRTCCREHCSYRMDSYACTSLKERPTPSFGSCCAGLARRHQRRSW
jgi:hypothetical protein